MRDTCCADMQRHEDFRKIVGRRLAFHIGAQCKDDFCRVFFADSYQKRLDSELSGAYVIERCKAPAEGMVKSLKGATSLQRKDVGGLLDDANLPSLPQGLEADFAKL